MTKIVIKWLHWIYKWGEDIVTVWSSETELYATGMYNILGQYLFLGLTKSIIYFGQLNHLGYTADNIYTLKYE